MPGAIRDCGRLPAPFRRARSAGRRANLRLADTLQLARQPAEERCSTLFAHRRQQCPELPAVARQHRLDLRTIAQYHADIIDSHVLDPVKPVNNAELKIHFVPRALWRNHLTGYENNTVRVGSAA